MTKNTQETENKAIPEYDQLPLPALQHRIRTLGEDELEGLKAYEEGHAKRPLVLQSMEHRLEELRSGAEPSGGDPEGIAPEVHETRGKSKVQGATTGPVQNPPSQGVPTNPGQPRDASAPTQSEPRT